MFIDLMIFILQLIRIAEGVSLFDKQHIRFRHCSQNDSYGNYVNSVNDK